MSKLERLLIVHKLLKSLKSIYCGVDGMGQKRCYFKKRTREVIENKGSCLKNKPKRTQKRSREVVENMFLWKKQTQNKPENKAGHVVENKRQRKNKPEKAAAGCAASQL